MIQKRAHWLTISILLFHNIPMSPALEPPDTKPSELDLRQVNKAATDAESLFLDEAGRIQAVEAFLKLVSIKGRGRQEEAIGKEVQRMLTQAGAEVVSTKSNDTKAPKNLIMEIPGSGNLAGRPGILLNAHLDTIAQSTPEFLAFDESTGDFYHLDATKSGKWSSFGGDDRAGVAVIVETIRLLQTNYWSRGVPHRRILLMFTAEEERGFVGAKYLSRHEPKLFDNLDISLSIDGPIDLDSDYPRDSFVAVVSESNSTIIPYKHVLELMQEFCGRTGARFNKTETGLGRGDFAYFPSSAHAGLHLRSVVQGLHSRERVNVQDLISQIDLLCYILLAWDYSLPLQEAAVANDIDTVKSLIEKGVEIDGREGIFLRTALHRAVAVGNREVAELLLSYGANPNTGDSGVLSALHYAATNGHKELVGLLITKGADVNAKNASGNTPLYNAVRNGHKDIAEMLLGKGAERSIHAAAFLGHVEDIQSFVEIGTSSEISGSMNSADNEGNTALHYAAQGDQKDVAELLIVKGANAEAKNGRGQTPLHLAVTKGHKDIAELLISKGADINATDRRGDTPLHSATKAGHEDIVELLMVNGADIDAKNKDGQTPSDLAATNEFVVILVTSEVAASLVIGLVVAIPLVFHLRRVVGQPKRFFRYFILLVGLCFVEYLAVLAAIALGFIFGFIWAVALVLGLTSVWSVVFGVWLRGRSTSHNVLEVSLFVSFYASLPMVWWVGILYPATMIIMGGNVVSVETLWDTPFGTLPWPMNTVLGLGIVLSAGTVLVKTVIILGGVAMINRLGRNPSAETT